MKSLTLTFLTTLIVSTSIFAQAPQAFKHQAVVRDNTGEIVSNQSVSFRINIHDGSASGTVIYRETFNIITNQFGLANMEIGNGIPVYGIFEDIDWGSNSKFMELELDLAGGTNYISMGTTQMMSVPYALYSENTANTDDADANPSNELQTVSKAGNTVTLSDGGGSFIDETMDADADPANELNTSVSLDGTNLKVTDAGGTISTNLNSLVDDADANPANELQALSIDGNDLSISDGNTVTLPGNPGDNLGNHTATQNIQLNGNWLSNDGGNKGVFVDVDGDVGIGTSAPINKLDVAGSMVIGPNFAGNESAPYNGLLVEGRTVLGDPIFNCDARLHVIGSSTAFPGSCNGYSLYHNDLVIEDDNPFLGLYGDAWGTKGSGINFVSTTNQAIRGIWQITRETEPDGNGLRFGNISMPSIGSHDTVLYLAPNGNVGIGTASPGSALDVKGTVSATSFVGDGSALTGIANDGDWAVSGDYVYNLNESVGIGTSAPINKLDVAGSMVIGPNFAGNESAPYNGLMVEGRTVLGDPIFNCDSRLHVIGSSTAFPGSCGAYSNYHNDLVIEDDNPFLGLYGDANGTNGSGINFVHTTNQAIRGIWQITHETEPDGNGLRFGNISMPSIGSHDTVLYLAPNGNVGIGTASPSTELDVSGVINMNGFRMEGGASDGYILTSDANGSGTWMPGGSLNLPYSDSVSSTEPLLEIISKGTGCAIYARYSLGNYGILGARIGNYYYGVYGNANNGHAGVFGEHEGGGKGVQGRSHSGAGIYGESTYGYGVVAFGDQGAIFAQSDNGHAGHFVGDVYMQNNLGIGTTTPASRFSNSSILASDGTKSTSTDGINWQIAADGYALGIENTYGAGSGLLVDAGNNGGTGATVAHFVSNDASLMYIGENGKVGIGTFNPSTILDVNGVAQMDGFEMPTGATSGYVLTSDDSGTGTWMPGGGSFNLPYADSVSTSDPAIKIINKGSGNAIYGRHNLGHYGILGAYVDGYYYGVYGYGNGGQAGVFGEYDGAGKGVQGKSTDGYGVYGESTNSFGVVGSGPLGGIKGELGPDIFGILAGELAGTVTALYGVYGSNKDGNYGMLGAEVDGFSYGVYGNGDNAGVFGEHEGGGPGVLGESVDGFGVWGKSDNVDGVFGESTNAYGVVGSGSLGGVRGENGSGFYGIIAGELSGIVTSSYGVYGSNLDENFGMLGTTVNGSNYGVYGNGDRAGVFGENVGMGPGVRGKSVDGDGVSGESTNSFGVVGSGPLGGIKGEIGPDLFGILAGELSGAVTALYGVYGSNKDGNYGMLGAEVDGFSYGVYGNGDNAGVFGEHEGGGPGVLGESVDGFGVWGKSDNVDGVFGESTNAYGVVGSGSLGGVRGENGSGFYGIIAGELSGTVTSSYGVYGSNLDENFGMLGTTVNGSNYGVYGNGDRAGVFGENVGMGPGVRGKSVDGDGVSGESTNSFGVVGSGPLGGIKGEIGPDLFGILAGELSGAVTALYGVYGSNKDGNYGMLGAEVDGFSYGVYGNGDNAGVFGEHEGGGPGVLGESVDGFGVWGKSDNGNGVFGESTNGTGVSGFGKAIGIYGQASDGHAGYFAGGVYIQTKLGIGTTNPLTNFEVSHSEDSWLRISADNDNSGGDDGTQNAYLQFTTDMGSEDFDGLIWLENLSGDTKLHFDVENQETMVMHNGRIGMGTASPGAPLEVISQSSLPTVILDRAVGQASIKSTSNEYLMLESNGNSLGLNWYTSDNVVMVNGGGKVGVGTASPATTFSNSSTLASDGNKSTETSGINWRMSGGGYALGIENSSGGGSGLLVKAGNNGGTGSTVAHFVSNNVSLMYIGENGNVGIGTSTPSQRLTVKNGSTTGTYTTSGWLHSSDARLKTNISQIDNALEKVTKLDGVYFDWKNKDEKHQVGLVAQDVEKVLPEVVTQDDEGYYSVSYGGVVPVLIEAIKEMKAENEELKKRIEQLENK